VRMVGALWARQREHEREPVTQTSRDSNSSAAQTGRTVSRCLHEGILKVSRTAINIPAHATPTFMSVTYLLRHTLCRGL
jgi:hypothetical protein